jgi:hypothetical protein
MGRNKLPMNQMLNRIYTIKSVATDNCQLGMVLYALIRAYRLNQSGRLKGRMS